MTCRTVLVHFDDDRSVDGSVIVGCRDYSGSAFARGPVLCDACQSAAELPATPTPEPSAVIVKPTDLAALARGLRAATRRVERATSRIGTR